MLSCRVFHGHLNTRRTRSLRLCDQRRRVVQKLSARLIPQTDRPYGLVLVNTLEIRGVDAWVNTCVVLVLEDHRLGYPVVQGHPVRVGLGSDLHVVAPGEPSIHRGLDHNFSIQHIIFNRTLRRPGLASALSNQQDTRRSPGQLRHSDTAAFGNLLVGEDLDRTLSRGCCDTLPLYVVTWLRFDSLRSFSVARGSPRNLLYYVRLSFCFCFMLIT